MKQKLFIFSLTLLICCWLVLPLAGDSISGTVKSIGATRLVLSGDAAMTFTTDSSGVYRFADLAAGGSYTITPERTSIPEFVTVSKPFPGAGVAGTSTFEVTCRTDYCGFEFNPKKLTITALAGDLVEQNFQVIVTRCCFAVTSVKFYIDNVLFYSSTSAGSTVGCVGEKYTCDLNTGNYLNGQHIFKVEAMDNATVPHLGIIEVPFYIINPASQRGDVNHDGTINIVDALAVAQHVAGLNPANFLLEEADADCNGNVSILDALQLARYCVGIIARTPEGCFK